MRKTVRSFNTELLVIGMIAGIHNFGFSADSEITVICRQIVTLSTLIAGKKATC